MQENEIKKESDYFTNFTYLYRSNESAMRVNRDWLIYKIFIYFVEKNEKKYVANKCYDETNLYIILINILLIYYTYWKNITIFLIIFKYHYFYYYITFIVVIITILSFKYEYKVLLITRT